MKNVKEREITLRNMAQLLGKKRGRPLKYENGWEGANKRICISNTTFSLWRDIREELGLKSDDADLHRFTHALYFSNVTLLYKRYYEASRNYNTLLTHLVAFHRQLQIARDI